MRNAGKFGMQRGIRRLGAAALSLLAIALLPTMPSSVRAQSTQQAQATPGREPLVIASEGSFYAGGHYDRDHPSGHIVGQIYVDYRIPQDLKHPLPIVLVHGGNQSGAGWFSTPDGRPGWAQYFLRKGYAIYVVDQVARGRSSFVPEVYGTTAAQPLPYVLEKFTSQERYKLWPQASLHTQWPGKGEPGDPAFDQYWSSDVPGMFDRNSQARMNVDALAALLDKIGPSILLVHSQSGGYAWPLAQARPDLVKAIVAAEPAGPPVHDVVVQSAQVFDTPWEKAIKQTDDDYFRDNPGVKPYGLTNIPLAYLPAITPESPLRFVQQEKPERPDLARCWRQMEPARKLVAVGDRPILVVEAEASFYAGYNHCNVEYLEQAGVHTTFIRLADIGIHGNGHMMMMEKNSDQIAQVIVDWMEKAVAPLEARQPVAR